MKRIMAIGRIAAFGAATALAAAFFVPVNAVQGEETYGKKRFYMCSCGNYCDDTCAAPWVCCAD